MLVVVIMLLSWGHLLDTRLLFLVYGIELQYFDASKIPLDSLEIHSRVLFSISPSHSRIAN